MDSKKDLDLELFTHFGTFLISLLFDGVDLVNVRKAKLPSNVLKPQRPNKYNSTDMVLVAKTDIN